MKRYKNIPVLIVIMLLMLPIAAVAYAASVVPVTANIKDYTVFINSKIFNPQYAGTYLPFLEYQGRLYAPARPLMEAVGGTVDWGGGNIINIDMSGVIKNIHFTDGVKKQPDGEYTKLIDAYRQTLDSKLLSDLEINAGSDKYTFTLNKTFECSFSLNDGTLIATKYSFDIHKGEKIYPGAFSLNQNIRENISDSERFNLFNEAFSKFIYWYYEKSYKQYTGRPSLDTTSSQVYYNYSGSRITLSCSQFKSIEFNVTAKKDGIYQLEIK